MSRILEIGPGKSPAAYFPGYLLKDASVQYFSIEADSEEFEDPSQYWSGTSVKREIGLAAIADSSAIPFADNTFASVIMRSVFGEYTMSPKYTGSGLENTRAGLYEAFRVLEEDGEIGIAEENTPWPPATPWQIGKSLLHAGFENVTVYPCQNMENEHWLRARTKYWGMQDVGKWVANKPLDEKWGYMITATRPEVEMADFSKTVVSKKAWLEAMRLGWGHPEAPDWVREVTLQRSAPTAAMKRDDPRLSTANITVRTKDEEFTLKDYDERRVKDEIEPLFAD